MLLTNKTDLSVSQSEFLVQYLLQWQAIGTNKSDSKKSIIWVSFKSSIKLVIPNSLIRKVKKFIPFMRQNMMPDFNSLIHAQNNYDQISLTDLENFKDFVNQQKILLKK